MKNKSKIILAGIGVVVSIALLVAGAILAEKEIINSTGAVIVIVIATVFVCIAIFCAAKIEYETSVYECKKCAHTFKPAFNAYIWGAHTLTTRHLKCPKCGEKSWCRRKMEN